MPTVHVREQGAVVRRRGERLLVTLKQELIGEVRLIDLEQLCLHGNVQLTAPATSLLLRKGTDVVYFSSYGKYLGRLTQTGSRMAKLRLAQLRLVDNEAVGLGIARQLVCGKLANQRTLVLRRKDQAAAVRRRAVAQAIQGIQAMEHAASGAATLDTLRGYEGKAGAYYFAAFRTLLQQDLGFTQRVYHPPTDPVNSLLSFGYTLLLKDVEAAVQLVGLDPYLSFYHAPANNRPALALDLMEEFRPILVDPMVLELVNGRQVTASDFVQGTAAARPVLMEEKARRLVLERYESRLASLAFHPLAGQRTAYRRCLELQAREMARVVMGSQDSYRSFVTR